MKKIVPILGLGLLTFGLQAQPVIESGNMLPSGSSGTVAIAPGGMSPGNGGANMTWDFSALNASVQGKYKIVSPDSTPYFSTFPKANFCIQLTPTGSSSSIYEYDLISSGKWEQLATNYAAGMGNNYNANPETRLPFPFRFGNSVTDTFVKTTGGPYTVDITYEGYGTLKTPYGTYSNVARIKYYWGPGDYDIHWVSIKPLFPIMVYSNEQNHYTLVGGVKPDGIRHESDLYSASSFYPNPFISNTTMDIKNVAATHNKALILFDLTGKEISRTFIADGQQTITLIHEGLAKGVYLYRLVCDKGILAQGRIISE